MASAATCQLDTSSFFQQLATAEQSFLVLDFDTTVAQMSGSRAPRFPFPPVTDLIECIAASARTRLIVASTATTGELASMLPCPDLELWGSDGLERIAPIACGNEIHRVPLRVQSQERSGRRELIDQRCAKHPLAYLVGAGEVSAEGEFSVVPEFHLTRNEVFTATPEPLVQFLAEWLRVRSGEVC